MSLTDKTRIETAADNCEVLRARLAKYEDDQGNPLGTLAWHASRADALQRLAHNQGRELAALKQPSAGVDERAARVIGYRPGMSEVTLMIDEGSIPAWMNIGDNVHISEKARAQLAAPAGVSAPTVEPAHSDVSVPRELPADWEDRILDGMNSAFEVGRLKDGGLVIDDTQVGVEFACKQISALLNGGRE